MRVVDPGSLCHAQRVCGRRPGHHGMLRPEPRELQADAHPPQLGHHSADHARRPAARVVLADRPQAGRCTAVPHAPDTGTRGHPVGPEGSDFRGILGHSLPPTGFVDN